MKFHIETHIVIDARKLETLIRLGCDHSVIFDVICGKKHKSSGDKLVDDLLESLTSKKVYDNWGGKRKNAGRKRNQLENQLENQLDNQDKGQLGTITLTPTITTTGTVVKNDSSLSGIRANTSNPPTEDEVLEYARQQNSMAGVGGFACSERTAQDFYDYYNGIGWCLPNESRTPIHDWRAFLRRWVKKPSFRTGATEPEEEQPFYL